ncbi:MAG: HlyC/CorC family transporter [Gemmatimonadetes bacterium]|nr:HlyC/CorC family transporter [Gemmatimonadota bacterium]
MLYQLMAIVGISLAVSFLCSILEAVILSVTQGYVHVLRDRGSKAGAILAKMQKQVDEPIAAILALNTIANTFGAALGGTLAFKIWGDASKAVFAAGLTLAILLFSEILPKTLGATLWPRLAPSAAYVLRGLIFVTKPIVIPLTLYARFITSGQGRPSTVSRSELRVLARIGRKEGALDEHEWRVVSSMMTLDEVQVGEVMTPRTDIVAVPVDATVGEAMTTMLDEGHLRIPVYDGTLDKIVGILLARDLWKADRDGFTEIRSIVRPIQFAPATKPVDDLISEMRKERVKMVIVVDEFGGTAGLATLEDLLEEIVGEIQDEHEEDEPADFTPLEAGTTRVFGGAPLREASEKLAFDLPEDDYDTVAGFVFGRLNRIPRVGDEVSLPNGSFRVLRMSGRRIEFLLFTPSKGGRAR